MPKLVPISYRKLKKILVQLGFKELRSKGSHHFFVHSNGRCTTLPFRKNDISDGLLSQILKDVGLSVEEYDRLR